MADSFSENRLTLEYFGHGGLDGGSGHSRNVVMEAGRSFTDHI